jgi:hypothetical protein
MVAGGLDAGPLLTIYLFSAHPQNTIIIKNTHTHRESNIAALLYFFIVFIMFLNITAQVIPQIDPREIGFAFHPDETN